MDTERELREHKDQLIAEVEPGRRIERLRERLHADHLSMLEERKGAIQNYRDHILHHKEEIARCEHAISALEKTIVELKQYIHDLPREEPTS